MAEIPEDQLVDLIIHSITGTQTESDRQRLLAWAKTSPERERFIRDVHDPTIASKRMTLYLSIDPRKGYARWLDRRRRKQQHTYFRIGGSAAVAAAFIVVACLWWKFRSDVRHETTPPAAVDTLAYVERTIENNTALSTTGHNYSDSLRILPDGTKVWLNADSRIFYPAKFAGSERVVELTGEAYFEVVRDAAKPFMVKSQRGGRVNVVGTNFDVMNYPDDDSVVVTLVKGEVNFEKDGQKIKLLAGQQVSAAKNGGISVPKTVDGEKVAEWKDNKFYFPDHSNLKTVLKRIARWYHLDLVYKVKISERRECGGEIERDLPVEQVLDVLKYKGIKFTVSNGQLIVEPEGSTSQILIHNQNLSLLD